MLLLIKYELNKLFRAKWLMILLIILTLLNAGLAFWSAEYDESFLALKDVSEEYQRDSQSVDAYFCELQTEDERYQQQLIEYYRGLLPEEPRSTIPYRYSGSEKLNDYQILTLYYNQQKVNQTFQSSMEREIVQCEVNKEEILSSYDSLTEESYAYRKQDLFSNGYQKLAQKVILIPEKGYAWDQFFSFDTVNIFLAVLTALSAAYLFLFEKGSADLLIRSTSKGRKETAQAKAAAIGIWTILLTLWFLLFSFLPILLKCGAFSDPSNDIHIFESMAACPFVLQIREYLLVFIGAKVFLYLFFSAISAFLCLIIRHMALGFGCSMGFVGVNFLLWKLGDPMTGMYANVIGAARFTSLVSQMRPVNVCGYAIDLHAVLFIGIVLFTIVLIPLDILLVTYGGRGPIHSEKGNLSQVCANVLERIRPLMNNKLKKANTDEKTSLLYFECKKITRNHWIMVTLCVAICMGIWFSANSYCPENSYGRMLYREYTDRLSGVQTEEKEAFLRAEADRISGIINSYARNRSLFLSGQIKEEEYSSFLLQYSDAKNRTEPLNKLLGHSEYLTEKEAKTGIGGCYLFDLDWERLFSLEMNPFLVISIVLICSGIFPGEYEQSGTIPIIRSTKKGRGTIFGTKLIFGCVSTAVLTVFFGLFEFWLIRRNFILPDWNAPLLSLEEFNIYCGAITIRQYFCIACLFRFLLLLVLAAIITVCGFWLKRGLLTVAVTVLALYAPQIAVHFGLAQMRYVDILQTIGFHNAFLLSYQNGDLCLLVVEMTGILLVSLVLLIGAYQKNSGRKLSLQCNKNGIKRH